MKNPILKKIYKYYENFFEKSVEVYKYYAIVFQYQETTRKNIYTSVKLSKEQKKQIDDFYIKNYGRKIPYIYHQYCTAFTGKFDVTYFPDLLYYSQFEKYLHYNRAYTEVLADKSLLPVITNEVGVKSPKIFLYRTFGVFRNENYELINYEEFKNKISNIGEAFCKPSIDSYGGSKCFVINMKNGMDKGTGKTVLQIIKELGSNFVIQERLHCHKSIADIYPHSVNTFRVITYQWKDKIYHCPIAMRIGSGGHKVDNISSGGMFIAVDDDGRLHDTAFTDKNVRYKKHPDTHIVFNNYYIPNINKIIKSAYKIHELLPHIGICHWDFSLDVNGDPILLEINLRTGGIRPSQMSHGKGLFGERTAEILQWIAKMKKLSYSEREKYNFGYMEPQL